MFEQELRRHPDRSKVAYVLLRIQNRFRWGFESGISLKSAKKNKPSAYQHPNEIDAYLAREVALGRVAGPFTPPPPDEALHVSSFGVIPKKGQPGKWRFIVDLSSRWGHSVNDGIDPQTLSLQYIKMDDVLCMVAGLGKGALLAKFDVENAYRNVPVHPDDRAKLGMKWRKQLYVDLMLPFGLRSAPFIFDSIAEVVEWILTTNYSITDLLHYLDDFLTAGPPKSQICARNLSKSMNVCARLGLPLHPQKCVGPTTCLVMLGIEIDTASQIARLPEDKFSAIWQLLIQWRQKKWCKKRELQSLIGHLHHACVQGCLAGTNIPSPND